MVKTRPRRSRLIHLAPDFEVLAALRADLRAWLGRDGISDEIVDDLLLVATELATNAIEATPEEGEVWLEAVDDERSIRLRVANDRAADAVDVQAAPLDVGSLQERGRGLAIVRALVDTLSLTSAEGRTVVCTVRFLS